MSSSSSPENPVPDVGFLLRRAGFGATPEEIAVANQVGLDAVVTHLVDYESVQDTFVPPPASILDAYRNMGSIAADLYALTEWWLGRMLTTSRPLQEKMVLFWHGHFATGIQKVRSTGLMYTQNNIFRTYALGRFDDLLSAVYKDPAMLIWLDGRLNTKVAPNENWGREMLELFTLGHGNYTEDDVHSNSRAFTGWRLTDTGDPVFLPRLHDEGAKTLLGQTGHWSGDDAVRIVASHPATGPFLATKLWRFFASDSPPAGAIKNLADAYYARDHSIREMVRTLFLMPEFYASNVRNGHIKSPTEFVIIPLRQLGISTIDMKLFPRLLATLGQELFNPPNVGGWPGGATWINASTMLGRFNYASSLTGDVSTKIPGIVDAPKILQAIPDTTDTSRPPRPFEIANSVISFVAQMLGIELTGPTYLALRDFVGPSVLDSAELTAKIPGLIHLALVSPEYQAS